MNFWFWINFYSKDLPWCQLKVGLFLFRREFALFQNLFYPIASLIFLVYTEILYLVHYKTAHFMHLNILLSLHQFWAPLLLHLKPNIAYILPISLQSSYFYLHKHIFFLSMPLSKIQQWYLFTCIINFMVNGKYSENKPMLLWVADWKPQNSGVSKSYTEF